MEVDEDCSGTIEWEEFLPVAGKFIAQKSPCEGVSSDMSPQTDMKGSREMLQTDTQVLKEAPPMSESSKSPQPARDTAEPGTSCETTLASGISRVPDSRAERKHQAPNDADFVNHPAKKESRDCDQGRERGLRGRLVHPVNFRDVGKGGGAATELVRECMQQRFQDVGEALVFFDLDREGSLTRARFELGLARMGLLHEVNPEQLLCEVNVAFNGRFSKLNGNDFLRHFHWGPLKFDNQTGAAMLQRALQNRDSVLTRGKPPPTRTPAKGMAPCAVSGRAFVPKQPPPTARARTRPGTQRPRVQEVPKTATHKSFADLRKERVDSKCESSTRLTVVASRYTGGEASTPQNVLLPQIGRAIEQCTLTGFSVASAVEADEAQTFNVLRISTPAETPRDGTPNRSSVCESRASLPYIPKSEEAAKMERWRDGIELAAQRGRIAAIKFM